jgi:GntR family transcriptional regulator/MocR family aminotransferase
VAADAGGFYPRRPFLASSEENARQLCQRRQWLESALQAQGFQVTPQRGDSAGHPVAATIALAQRRTGRLAVQALSDWRMEPGEGADNELYQLTSEEMANLAVRKLDVALYPQR